MEKDEFIEELGIEGESDFLDDGSYLVAFSEDQWLNAQTILDNSDEVEEDQESSVISYEISNLQYLNDYFIINLIADFSADEYKLIIKDR